MTRRGVGTKPLSGHQVYLTSGVRFLVPWQRRVVSSKTRGTKVLYLAKGDISLSAKPLHLSTQSLQAKSQPAKAEPTLTCDIKYIQHGRSCDLPAGSSLVVSSGTQRLCSSRVNIERHRQSTRQPLEGTTHRETS
ncbi:hypothetical protein FQN60_003251 [Etheostoma spectabile]|uniref:Uncharacterized protein n=1 Tax=Etheostoma spectabile TaxID=54343 RepID=A0A5J5CMU8_9PERO|nr:hypothetical protein FQN60_003251 [Etheostoma spectabile]